MQKGVVRETICGENLLISTKEAREHCPYLTQLNESSAFIWAMIESGRESEDMISAIMQKYEVSKEEAHKGLNDFLSAMEKQNFIIKEA